MPDSGIISDTVWKSYVAQSNVLMREMVQKSRDILRGPAPDLFLGRKTQEPFPSEEV
jgi:hypothetical protein